MSRWVRSCGATRLKTLHQRMEGLQSYRSTRMGFRKGHGILVFSQDNSHAPKFAMNFIDLHVPSSSEFVQGCRCPPLFLCPLCHHHHHYISTARVGGCTNNLKKKININNHHIKIDTSNALTNTGWSFVKKRKYTHTHRYTYMKKKIFETGKESRFGRKKKKCKKKT